MNANKEILAGLYADPILAFRVLLSHWFPKKMPWVHRGLVAIRLRRTDFLLNFGPEVWRDETGSWTEADLELMARWFVWTRPDGAAEPIFTLVRDDEGTLVRVDMKVGKYTCIVMPRGFAKTTLNNAIDIFKILFEDTKFILKVGETSTHAERQLGNIKTELESNERILELFGNLAPDRQSPKRWTQDEIETLTGIYMTARGRGGQVRGLNVNSQRPTDIDVDDVEDEESVSTPEQRDKALSWFMAALKPCLPRLDPSATMTVMGTLLHREAILLRLSLDAEWTFIRFGAKLPDGSWLWPEMMDEKGWDREKASYALQGKLSKFYMEFGSELRDDDSAKFREEFFVNIIQPRSRGDSVARALVIDPAISNKKGADRCSLAVAGITDKGIIHLYDSYGQVGMNPREQVDKYFEFSQKWDCTRHGVESISYQAALIHLLREEMFRRKRYFEIEPITHGRKKTERIEGVLQPRFAARYVTWQREFPVIRTMLLDWPNAGFDDIDAFAMAVTLLDPFAAQAADPERDICDDEFPPLDEAIGGQWCNAP